MRAALSLALLVFHAAPFAGAAPQVGDEPLRNSVPLPTHRAAEEALTAGDTAAARVRDGVEGATLRRAFDLWHDALLATAAGDGVRTRLDGAPAGFAPDPDGVAERRADGPTEAVLRRLAALSPAERVLWRDRFGPLATSGLERALASDRDPAQLLARVERDHPATDGARRAALALFDLALEEGRPVAAALWLGRARRHGELLDLADDPLGPALGARQRALVESEALPRGVDHATPPAPLGAAPSSRAAQGTPRLQPVRTERIVHLRGRASDPLLRGLGTGLAALRDGTVVVQSALGLLTLPPGGGAVDRRLTKDVLGIPMPIVQATSTSGGWASLPATNGEVLAVVVGRGDRPRSYLDIEVPAVGNHLAIVGRGAPGEALRSLWTMRDGIRIDLPEEAREGVVDPVRPAPLGGGLPVEGWSFGRGWEFQPGPVIADGTLFVLGRGLGDPTDPENSHADEVRLFALDLVDARVHWSREITRERGTAEDVGRGRAGIYAATTMPLALDRRTGVLLVGSNVGLLAAYGAAEGRLLWAFARQRAAGGDAGWAGATCPQILGDRATPRAWFTPLGSEYAYALPSGLPPLDGDLLVEAPRPAGSGRVLAGVRPTEDGDDLALLGRDGRHDALLLQPAPDPVRGVTAAGLAAAHAGPDDVFTGRAATAQGLLFAATDTELLAFDPARDFAPVAASPLDDRGSGRGGNLFWVGDTLWVTGRDTLWIYALRRP